MSTDMALSGASTPSSDPDCKTSEKGLIKTIIPFSTTGQFRELYLDYTSGNPAQKLALKPFYRFEPTLDGIGKMIEARKDFSIEQRQVLVDVLLDQYKQAGILSQDCQATIKLLLKPTTFTITTGHQLSIGLGPQYVAFKILTIIKLAQKAKEWYPAYTFVPIMWLSGEDHDIEEISTVRINGRDMKWNTAGKGPAGFLPTDGLAELLLAEGGEIAPIIQKYGSYSNLADAQLYLTDALFGDLGIIALNANDKRLKQFANTLFEKEVTEGFSHPLVEAEGRKLEALGYHAQIVTRPINLFLIKPGKRDRIEEVEGGYKAGAERFSKEQLLNLLKSNPEKFSPNVATRPMYQEVILPNLAYIGGPAEVAYWLMLKPAFDAAGVAFPLVWPRQNMLLAPAHSLDAWREAGFGLEDLFRKFSETKKTFINRQTDGKPELSQEHLAWSSMFAQLKEAAGKLDPNAERSIAADEVRMEKQREKIFQKVEKAYERKFTPELKALEQVREFFLPGNSLQERVESYLTLYLKNPYIAQQLLEVMDPETAGLLFLEELDS